MPIKPRACTNCKNVDHNIKNCPRKEYKCDHDPKHTTFYDCENNVDGPSKAACTNCKKVDHTKRTCPYKEFECEHDPEHTTYYDCENNIQKVLSNRSCSNCKETSLCGNVTTMTPPIYIPFMRINTLHEKHNKLFIN